jgi:hypothetical protein
MIIRAEPSIPHWRRNVVIQSNWSGWLHQVLSRDIGLQTSNGASSDFLGPEYSVMM